MIKGIGHFMDTEEYRKKIEQEVLDIIEQKLKDRQMSAERAREIARYVLQALHPRMDMNQIHAVVQNFDDYFPELIPIVIKVSNDYEEKVKKVVGEHVGNLLKQNKITEASTLLNKALNKQVKI